MKTGMLRITLLMGLVVMAAGWGQAESLSGPITTTRTLTQDTDLTGDVACTVSDAPCLVFGAPGIQLRLHGHTITGQGFADACPTVAFAEVGIQTNGQPGVSIVGPGLVRRFREHGIVVRSDHAAVRQLVVASSCANGIAVFGQDNRLEQTTVVRAALVGPGFAGIFCGGGGGHLLRHNEVVGGGGPGITVASTPGAATHPNLLEGNSVSGNDGIGLILASGTVGTTIRRNAMLGNRQGPDVLDGNPAGTNRYEANLCETSLGGATSCSTPAISGHEAPLGIEME